MKRWMTFALLIVAGIGFCSPQCIFGADDDEQEEIYRFRFRYVSQQGTRSGTPPSTDHADHGHSTLSEAEFKKAQDDVRQFIKKRRQKGGPLTKADVVEIYSRAKDFKVVHSLLGNAISLEESRQIGRLRQEIHNEALETLHKSKRFGHRMGVNDFGSGADMSKVDAKTDIDFTLYADDPSIKGTDMVRAYLETFRQITGRYYQAIDPGQCDIVAHRYEATIPDWQMGKGSGNFTVRLRTGLDLLKSNPEAYFLEGAYHQQVMGRSVDPKAQTFLWYETDANGKLVLRPVNAGKVPAFFYHPQFGPRYAWGGAVGNWHFFHAHGDDKAAQGKYLLRSIDNGLGLLLKGKTAEFEKMSKMDRQRLIRRLYQNAFDDATFKRIYSLMETAVNMRKLKSAKALDMGTESGKMRAYQPLIDRIRQEHYGVEVSDAELLKMAEKAFLEDGNRLLVYNNINTAEPRLGDWLSPKLRSGQKLDTVDEDGNKRQLTVDDAMIKRLQYSAFFELKHGFSLMTPDMIQKIKKANPKFARDIEILERVIKKQRQLMDIPEHLDPDSAVLTRQQLANNLEAEYHALKQSLANSGYASGALQVGKTVWASGNQMEEWFKQATLRRVVGSIGGKKAIPHLHALFDQVKHTNDKYLGPTWMARIDKGTSLLRVINTYMTEGEINDVVINTAVYEIMSYVPGMSVVYAVQGGVSGIATITFVTIIPGYGQVLLVCNFAKGAVELAGNLIFQPLKWDKVQLAYQGYLDPAAGGIIHAGQTERVESPRPALLLYIDPDGSLPLDQRREKIYRYFHNRVVADMKQLPSVWYDEYEMPREWMEKEFEVLRIRIRQYVDDWWNGTGVFSEYDTLTVHRGPDIRPDLEKQLYRDYVTGRQIALGDRIKKREGLMDKIYKIYAAIAGAEQTIDDEYSALQGVYDQNGELMEAYVLDSMPTAEPSLQIIAAPNIEEVDVIGTEDETEDLIEQINLRANIIASKKDFPIPWNIKWEVRASGADTVKFDPGQEEEMEALKGSVRVRATAYDAEGKKIAHNEMTFEVEKVDVDEREENKDKDKDGEGKGNLDEARRILDEMRGEAVIGEGQSGEAAINCENAVEKSEQAKEQIKKLKSWLGTANSQVSTVESKFESLKTNIEQLKADQTPIEDLALKVAEARTKANQAALKVCEMADAINNASSMEDRNKHMDDLKEAKKTFEKELKEAREALKQMEVYAERITDAKKALEALNTDIQEAQSSINDAQVPTDAANEKVGDAQTDKETASTKVKEAQATQNRTSGLLDKGNEVIEKVTEVEGASEELKKEGEALAEEMKGVLSGVKELVDAVKDCPEETQTAIQPVQDDFKSFQEDVTELQDKLDEVRKKLAEGGYAATLEDLWQDIDAALFVAQVMVEDINEREADVQLCATIAYETMDKPLMVRVPNLYGKSAQEAMDLLNPLNLKWMIFGGTAAPSQDLEHKVEAQSPTPNTRVEVKSAVEITLYSDYKELIAVPDVKNKHYTLAMQELADLGFAVNPVEGKEADSEEEAELVISQHPAPPTSLEEGSLITIHYLKKPVMVVVPQLKGMTEADARATLSQLGLGMSTSDGEEAPTEEKSRTVAAQSPGPDSKVKKNSSVAVTLYKKYVKKIRLAQYLRMNINNAASQLRGLGVSVVIHQEEDPPEPDRAGEVTGQSPRPGTEIRVGEDVVHLYGYKEHEETEYFVVVRLYGPHIPDKLPEDELLSTYLSKYNPDDMPLKAGDGVMLLHIAGEGLKAYPMDFFRNAVEIATPVTYDITVYATEEEPQRSGSFPGALLFKVQAVTQDVNELAQYGADARVINRDGYMNSYLRLHSENGSFSESQGDESSMATLRGGPFEPGWSSTRRREMLDMYVSIFRFFGCFIATTVYQDPFSSQLTTLRSFRDGMLRQSDVGRRLINKYYNLGPKYARNLQNHPVQKIIARHCLDILAYLIKDVNEDDPLAQWFLLQSLRFIDLIWIDEDPGDFNYLISNDKDAA